MDTHYRKFYCPVCQPYHIPETGVIRKVCPLHMDMKNKLDLQKQHQAALDACWLGCRRMG